MVKSSDKKVPAKRLRSSTNETAGAASTEDDGATQQQQQKAGGGSVELLHCKVMSPHVSGIVAMAVNTNEDRLVVAREDGSLVLFKLDFFQNVCHMIKLSSTGGRKNRSVRGVHFMLRDTAIAVTYLSGQYVLFDVETLLPTAMQERTGGPIFSSHASHNGSLLFSAIGDGTTHCVAVRMQSRMDLAAIFPKVSGANRCMCVFSSSASGVVVCGDDAGHVTCWSTSPVTSAFSADNADADTGRGVIPGSAQNWCTKLGTGIPMSVIVHDKSATCAIGTSVGEVVLINLLSGSVVSAFTHHRGPVTVLALGSDEQSFFASGYHESLRSYRQQQNNGAWHPADVRRRTHYHEATAICVLSRFPFLFSAARDGTIMHSRLATLFSAPVQYSDVSTQTFAFAKDRSALLQASSTALQVLRLNARRTQWIPLFQFVPEGQYFIKAAWANSDLSMVAFATDVRFAVFALDWEANDLSVKSMRPIFSRSAVGVRDCCFHGDDVYILTSFAVWHLPKSIGYKSIEHNIFHKTHFDRMLVVVAAPAMSLHVFGQHGSATIPANEDGTLRSDEGAFVPGSDRAAVDFVSSVEQGDVTALVGGKHYSSNLVASPPSSAAVSHKPVNLVGTLPHDASIFSKNAAASSSHYLASFSRGIIDVSSDQWRMIKRMPVVKCFDNSRKDGDGNAQQPACCIALERNIEGAVETLPPCWKVRRFGN